MSEQPPNKWKQPLTGKRKWLAWFALLVVVFLVVARVLAVGLDAALLTIVAFALVGLLVKFVRWLCCWRNFRRFLFGVACLITLIALFYAEENWRGRHAWENHRRALEAKGDRFTIAELAPRPVPDEQNFALTPLLRPPLDFKRVNGLLVWNDTNGTARLEKVRADLQSDGNTDGKLALGSLEKGTFADLAACQKFYQGNTNYPQRATAGTPAEDMLFALGKFDAELKELREAAATRPLTRFPIEYDYEPSWAILLPHLAHLKGLTVLTLAHATAELEVGHSAEALVDLKLGFRISDSIRDEPVLIDHLVRIATVAISLQGVREGLVRHAWNDAQLVEIEKYLASPDLLAEYKLAMRGERLLATEGLDFVRRQGFRVNAFEYLGSEEGAGASTGVPNLMPSGWFYQNMLTISQMHQDYTLAAVDEKSHRVFPERGQKLDAVMANMPFRPYSVFARMLMPALSKAVRRSARMQTYVDEARIACALERHRIATGALPEALDALVPRFIEKIPADVMDGKPLRYRRNQDGSYLLYSIGWNQTDDRGEIAWTKGKDTGVDIAKGDWVWQMPAKPEAP